MNWIRAKHLAFTCILLASLSGVVRAEGSSNQPKSLWKGLAQLTQVQSIDIEDDWMGLSEFGPIKKHYLLKPEADHFAGKAIFSLGGGNLATSKEEPISIPNEVMKNFLRLLSEAPLEKGEYRPLIEHTDDYPDRIVVIQLGSGKLSFFSKSQGEWAVPWGATWENESFVVNAKNPGEALKLLQSYLKDESMQKFMEEVRAKNRNR